MVGEGRGGCGLVPPDRPARRNWPSLAFQSSGAATSSLPEEEEEEEEEDIGC
jgi:hypothetical protein